VLIVLVFFNSPEYFLNFSVVIIGGGDVSASRLKGKTVTDKMGEKMGRAAKKLALHGQNGNESRNNEGHEK
jgi:hypothetical protein